jgi:hypothetical protein
MQYGNKGCGVFKQGGGGGSKLERFLQKNQYTQRKFWINGELSKIGLHFNNKKI